MNRDLLLYGDLVNAKSQLETLVNALRLEKEQLTAKVKSLSISDQTVKSLQTIDANTKQQFLLVQKVGATAEFSPLVKAARGQYVDLDELKKSVIRAMGIMCSRLNSMINGGTRNKLLEAIEGLDSEILIP